MEFTNDECQLMVELLRSDLDGYYETLKDEHTNLAAAMIAYDATPAVALLTKLDPEGAALQREETRSYIAEYHD